MCGICGIYNLNKKNKVSSSILQKMNDTMKMRGPDGEGFLIDENFGMAMRRLSIIDLNSGKQPISNEDDTISVILNGELYNYIELRQELEQKGHQFSTNSDVEVLVHLYEDEGTEAIHHLNGMFAFCLWDKTKRRMWIGRDRLGIKPLVYFNNNDFFAFGSTLDTITAHPDFKKEIDEDSFLLYLTLAYVPAPKTIFKDIKKLPPGHFLIFQEGNIHIKEYWEIEHKKNDISGNEFQEALNILLKSSIMFRERSDVPVGCMLSGGIDSSGVTALFSNQSPHAVHTYSMDFEEKNISEHHYARIVSDRYHTIHHPFRLSTNRAFLELKELIPQMDEPMADSAIIPSYFISKCARDDGIKVVLTGAGGDELYGGYLRHYKNYKEKVKGCLSFLPIKFWKILLPFISQKTLHYGLKLWDKGIAFGLGTSGVHMGVLGNVIKNKRTYFHMVELLKYNFKGMEMLEKKIGFSYSSMATDMNHYLPDNILSLTDKTSMAASIEARVPLLDHRLVELVFSVRSEINLAEDFLNTKKSLKEVFRKILPEEILYRKKAGFNGPVNHWLNNPAVIDQLKNTSNPVIRKFINLTALNRILESKIEMEKASETVFMLYIFDLWYSSHVE